MLKKAGLFVLIVLFAASLGKAQKAPGYPASQMKPSFKRLLLYLSTTYFTVVKENQVDLDSSLIHVSHSLSLSRLPVVAEGIDDKDILSHAQWVDQRKPWIGQQQLNATTAKKHAILLILLGAYYAFEPLNNAKASYQSFNFLNRGIEECDKLGNADLKLTAQRLLGKLYLKNYDFKNGDALFAKVADGFTKAGNKLAAATTYSWWGLYAPVTPASTQPRIKHMEMALAQYKSLDDKEDQVNVLINDNYLHVLLNDLTISEKLDRQALQLTDMIGFPYRQYITGAISSITMFEGKFGEPLFYGIQNIQASVQTRDNIGMPYFCGAVADLYANEQKPDLAMYWEKKAIDILLSQHETDYYGIDAMMGVYLYSGRKKEALYYIEKMGRQAPAPPLDNLFYNLSMGTYYTYTKQWTQAHQFLNNAASTEKELEKHGLNVRRGSVLGAMGFLYFSEGNYKKAKIYYNEAVRGQIFGRELINETIKFESLIKVDSILGDYKDQLKDYAQLVNKLNQNYTISKTRQAEELQVKYATADRINQINALNQKAKLEQENLKQANRVKDITIGGIILLVIIAGLLYRQTRMKQKTNNIINRKNELMQQLLDEKELLLEEKEWLVKEIHHRVKNNLHTIICLLESQAAYLDNDALKAIETSQHRIYAMSLIHQKLYQSDDIKVLDMHDYLTEFVRYLEEGFGSPENIKVTLNAEHINLGAAQAIPVGLIINEAVNNSFKYAFPDFRKGKIEIALKRIDDEIYLSVADDGVGFKRDADKEFNSLGLELIKGLTLDLRGKLDFNSNNGTNINIIFKIDHVGMPLQEVVR